MRKLLSLAFLLCACYASQAQVTGTSPVLPGQAFTYTYNDGNVYGSFNFFLDNANGVVSNMNRSGTVHTCTVTWSTAGTSVLSFSGFGTVKGTKTVTINCPSLTTPSATFSYPSTTTACGSVPITYTGAPPTGVKWYWQSSSSGTSTANATSSFSATSSGTYYLRANCLSNWSSAQSTSAVTVKIVPTVSGSNVSFCSGGSTGIVLTNNLASTLNTWTVSSTNVSGASNSNGTSGASNPYTYTLNQTLTATSNTNGTSTYTITPSVNGCTGSAVNITATVKPIPNASASNQTIFTGSTTSISISNPNGVSGTTFTWTSTPTNVAGSSSGSGTSIAQTLTMTNPAGGSVVYAITPTASSCSGSVVNVTATVTPPPLVTSPSGGIKVMGDQATLDAGTGYLTYAWKNTANPGTTLGTAQTYGATVAGNYTVTVTKTGVTGSGVSATYGVVDQFTGLNLNYVISNKLLTATSDTTAIKNLSVDFLSQSAEYYDGLGRPIQSVITQGSPAKKDLVNARYYDDYSRESRKYLPFAADEITGYYKAAVIDGSGNFANAAYNFYNNGTGDMIIDDTKPYSETTFESSEINRPLKNYGPGSAWRTADKYVALSSGVNLDTASEKVIAWIINGSGMPVRSTASNTWVAGGFFKPAKLTVKSTKDENLNEVREFINTTGQTILKKVMAVSGSSLSSATGWAQTYYIYDDYGLLRYVLQPELTKTLVGSGGNPTQTNLDNYAFQYKYDGRNRMIQKRVPGADWVYMIYDKRDRLVMTQDGVQRPNKQWTFTKYDRFNRPVMTGIWDTTATVSQTRMQDTVVLQYYQKASSRWYDSIASSGTRVHDYSVRSFPVVKDASKYLLITYYDNYTFNNSNSLYAYKTGDVSSQTVNGITYSQASAAATATGQVTGTKVKVLDVDIYWLKTLNYYDAKSRLVQSLTDHQRSGIQRLTNIYDFAGTVLASKTTYTDMSPNWTDLVNAKAQGNRLLTTAHFTNWGSNGAASSTSLASSTDGWVEATFQGTGGKMIGLSATNADASYTSIKYAIAVFPNQPFQAYENGTGKGTSGANAVAGDVIRIERVGSTIYYKANGTTFYTSAVTYSGSLLVDAAMYYSGPLLNVRTSFVSTSQTVLRKFSYDHAGRLVNTWHSLNGASDVLLSHNTYNALGQLVDKSLHSTDGGTTFKQSTDYRYNVRGWMTSINNSRLSNDSGVTNDDTNDFFGLNLGYESDMASMSNTASYNGNISGMRWSTNAGAGSVKELGYQFSYDALNRLTAAGNVKSSTLNSWSAGDYDENNLTYDLNGNILTLKRKGDGGVWIDDLAYNYGSTKTNQLVYVQDNVSSASDKPKGFTDGNTGTASDYNYDANGNMLHDLNKGIGTALADGGNIIAYNFLNLPSTVSKAGNGIRYIYDATGRKLSQQLISNTFTRQTDYLGELNYENDVLQFVNHEEGRIVVTGTNKIFNHTGETTSDLTAVTATLLAQTTTGETYIKVTSSGTSAGTGVFPAGGTFPVTAGQRYKIRVKGYRAGSNPVYIRVKASGTDVDWPGTILPYAAVAESWIEQIVTIPTGATTLQAGVSWNTTVANGEIFYINEMEIVKLTAPSADYQYFLKDHLGNVRVTFSTTLAPTNYTATFETGTQTQEQADFLNYSSTAYDLVDHTDAAGTTYTKVQYLNGGVGGRVGLAKAIPVMPGDEITLTAYGKYRNLTGTSNTTSFITGLATAFGVSAGSTGEQLRIYNGLNTFSGTVPAGDHAGDNEGAPKAFVTILFFDKNYNLIDAAWDQMTTTGLQTSGTTKEPPHDILSQTKKAPAAGYAYVFLSNENPTFVDVYFDDVILTVTPTQVVQSQDYYPFGLAFNSFNRENSVSNPLQYNEKELQDELNLGWLDYGARMYSQDLGRWQSVDPLSEKSRRWSAYSYVYNNPLRFIDPDGMYGLSMKERGEMMYEESLTKTGEDDDDTGKDKEKDDKKGKDGEGNQKKTDEEKNNDPDFTLTDETPNDGVPTTSGNGPDAGFDPSGNPFAHIFDGQLATKEGNSQTNIRFTALAGRANADNLSFSAEGLGLKIQQQTGNSQFAFRQKLDASLFSADGKFSINSRGIQAGVGAYVGKVVTTTSFTLWGFTIQGTAGVTGGSLHASGALRFTGNSVELKGSYGDGVGWIRGVKVSW